jgi:hypothetical protein
MGYWGQFKRADESLPMTYDDYFTIKAENGADKITMTGSIVVTTEKLPPDSMLHIKGYVADIYGSPVTVSKIATPERALSNPVASSGTDLEKVMFENITRRYFNKHSIIDDTDKLHLLAVNVTVSDIMNLPVKLVLKDGLMSEANAKQYGVHVYLSDEAKKLVLRKKKDGEGNEKDQNIYFEAGWTIGQTITRIMSYLDADLEFTFSNQGDVLIYTPEEMIENLQSIQESYEKQGLYKQTVLANPIQYDGKIPAVYNINVDAVATITCPFFTFIEPFQYVEFASRYAITSTVSYFASYSPTILKFLVISATISFATVDDVNEVQITAVSAREDKKNG